MPTVKSQSPCDYTSNVDNEILEGWKRLYNNKHMMELRRKSMKSTITDILVDAINIFDVT